MANMRNRRVSNPPVPNERKRALGNPGKRTLPKESTLTILPGQSTAPEPPLPLGDVGRGLWETGWKHAAAWMAPSDQHALALVCQAFDEREVIRGEALAGDWRARNGLRNVDKQIMDGLSLLGFTPTDRTRLGVAEVRIDELEAFKRRSS